MPANAASAKKKIVQQFKEGICEGDRGVLAARYYANREFTGERQANSWRLIGCIVTVFRNLYSSWNHRIPGCWKKYIY